LPKEEGSFFWEFFFLNKRFQLQQKRLHKNFLQKQTELSHAWKIVLNFQGWKEGVKGVTVSRGLK
jgi:hypothetical protein